MGMKLAELNEKLRSRVLEAMGQACEKKRGGIPCKPKMSKTEAAYYREILLPLENTKVITHVKYEGITLHLSNGHRYKPDWTYLDADKKRHCVEVKGGHKLPSERSARFAFDQAVLEFPDMGFLWVRKTKGGWEV